MIMDLVGRIDVWSLRNAMRSGMPLPSCGSRPHGEEYVAGFKLRTGPAITGPHLELHESRTGQGLQRSPHYDQSLLFR